MSSGSSGSSSVYLVAVAILFIAAIITLSLSRFNTSRAYVQYTGSLEHALRARGLLGGTTEAEEIAVEPLPLYSKYPTGGDDADTLPNSRPPSFRSQIVPAPAGVGAEAADARPPDFDAPLEPRPPPPAAFAGAGTRARAVAGVDAVAVAAEPHQHAATWVTSAAAVQAALGTSNRGSVEASP
ncbi:hypothetical protein HDU87_001153 [Geranomyces variabilis]|uniref:Uncharacterized protein n=1 Tax=Geranomyces variabilis TaxID=109894 RepID=A0AAD5TD88_9FUNG|nr:hypothetical protein HDU87_001153 [Geranomyces variabilis]